MCSIIGYLGQNDAAPILVKGLYRMEYRGYDSVGVATQSGNTIELKKGAGKVREVDSRLQLGTLPGSVGIGHTRWATHGSITDSNAHPHASNSGKIAIVHNGIIENFEELRKGLLGEGYQFKSDTDSEVIANLLQKNHQGCGDIKEAMLRTVSALKGQYAFVAMFDGGQLAAARLHRPLIVGLGKNGYFLSSDVLGFIEQTDEAIYIDSKRIVVIDDNAMEIVDFDGAKASHETTKVSKEFADAYKGDYAHFTIKEISEQQDIIMRAAGSGKRNVADAVKIIKDAGSTYITGSGSSYNAALVAKQLFSKYARKKAEPVIASEVRFLADGIERESVLIAISQSGESADVLEAVAIAKGKGCKIISIVNHMTSSLARESDVVVAMNCGPEIGVAATKSFTSQILVLYQILQEMAPGTQIDYAGMADAVSKILEDQAGIKRIAGKIRDVSDIYVLGRGIHYPIAIEAALKLKELTYIHAEGIAGGELKHGPLALMDSDVYVVIINPDDDTHSDTITSASEIKARDAKIIGISDVKSDLYDHWIKIPAGAELGTIISEIIPVQLLSYHAALEKKTDPDYPRNLAKSVTVR